MAEPVVADLIQQQHGLAGGQTHGGADGFVPAAGLEVGHIGSHLLAALPLQDLEYVARQVDAGEVPAAEEGAGQVVDGVMTGVVSARMRFLMQITSSPGSMASSRASSSLARTG